MALPFSESDKAKYMTGQYFKELAIVFPNLELVLFNEDIYSESLSLEESIFDGNAELSVVGCISNRFSIEIRNQGVQLKNQNIMVLIRIDGGSFNRIFTGYVESVETVRDRSYQKLQCYDALYKFQDKNFYDTYSSLAFPVTIRTLRDAIFNYIGIPQEQVTLINDSVSITQTIEDGEIAVIDAIRAICQMNGVFGKINADGVFKYVDLEIPSEFLPFPSDDIFPAKDLFPAEPSQETTYIDKYESVAFEDYELVPISGVTVRDSASDANYGQSGTSTNLLLVEGNIWCNALPAQTKQSIAANILQKVKDIVFQPFEAASIGLPYTECGDAVAYYVFDYSSGQPETEIMGFSVMTRYLKGIQWMRDTYSANGSEYQPEVRYNIESDTSKAEIESVKSEVNTVKSDVDDVKTDLNSKQDILTAGEGIDITDNVISATGGKGGINYTLEEQDTGLTYTYNGTGGVEITKKVYQISFDNIRMATDGSYITIDVTDLDPLFIVSTDAVMIQNINGQAVFNLPCPFYQSADNYCYIRGYFTFGGQKDIYVWSKLTVSGFLNLTIRYVKDDEPPVSVSN